MKITLTKCTHSYVMTSILCILITEHLTWRVSSKVFGPVSHAN